MAFPSVYEMTNPLTTVRKQHFWEYFSGATLSSKWGSVLSWDSSSAVGFTISGATVTPTHTTQGNDNWIRTTDTTPISSGVSFSYNLEGSSTEGGYANTNQVVGISKETSAPSSGGGYSEMDFALYNDASGLMVIENGVAYGNWAVLGSWTLSDTFSIDVSSSGVVTYNKNGVTFHTSTATASGDYYLMASNYRMGAITQARVLPVVSDITGTGTYAMVDGADEGFSILSSTNGARSAIGFNNIRQFSPTASVAIFDLKRMTDASHDSYAGFKFDATNSTFYDTAVVSQASYATNIGLYTGASTGTPSNQTDSNVARDTAWHNYKIENGSANIKLSIDGVVKITKTSERPVKKMQPFVLNSTNTSASKETRIKYFEAYNT
tara:strand:+ start:31 stop:1170 length:1140 start_codon:yes stop_codon:yes gene_type:complete